MRNFDCEHCGQKAYEGFSTCGICNECNLSESKIIQTDEDQMKLMNMRTGSLRNENMFSSHDYMIVQKVLLNIPEKHRLLLVLRFWEGLSINDIAEIMFLRVSTVKSILEEAYEKLKLLCLDHPDFSRSIKFLSAA